MDEEPLVSGRCAMASGSGLAKGRLRGAESWRERAARISTGCCVPTPSGMVNTQSTCVHDDGAIVTFGRAPPCTARSNEQQTQAGSELGTAC